MGWITPNKYEQGDHCFPQLWGGIWLCDICAEVHIFWLALAAKPKIMVTRFLPLPCHLHQSSSEEPYYGEAAREAPCQPFLKEREEVGRMIVFAWCLAKVLWSQEKFKNDTSPSLFLESQGMKSVLIAVVGILAQSKQCRYGIQNRTWDFQISHWLEEEKLSLWTRKATLKLL